MPSITYTTHPNGLTLATPAGLVLLTPYNPRLVRVRCTLAAEISNKPSLAACALPDPAVTFSTRETPETLYVSTSELTIAIDRTTAAFSYFDRNNNLLTKEPAGGGKRLEPVDVLVSVFDETTSTVSRVNADGVRVDAVNVKKRVDRQAYHTRLDFEWQEGEALYGLGSHEEGMLNLRGQKQYLYQQNMKAVVPVLVSTRGYAVILDSYAQMRFHDDESGSYLWSEVDDELDYYIAVGPELDQLVAEIRWLTGQSPMLPKWAFGYIQSKERYKTQHELVDVVSEYRARQLPLDCIVLDWMSWTGSLWGQKSLDPERFPDPDKMTADLHALNARMMVSIWPIMRSGGENWLEMQERNFLLGNQATYDAFNPAARALYWKQANEGLFSKGIDAWWCDCTEPFEADWKGAVKPEPEERMRINTEEAKRYLDPEFINAYSLLHSQGIYEGQRGVTHDKRVVNLTRSAYLGQQRYATITWSGDIAASWDTLRAQIAEGLSFCMTGMPYWTLDIGAFFVRTKPELWFWAGQYDAGVDDLGYRELYVRWFQYAAFLPMFRSHGTDTPREIWRFGEPGEPMYEALVKFLRLRYRLLPYIYSLAGWTTQRAYTMLRGLAFDFRSDPTACEIKDQFMFGPALLVCPVAQPMLYGPDSQPLATSQYTRPVYLPAGSAWFDFWTGARMDGGQTIEAGAGLDTIPLYVKAGSILPVGPVRQHTSDLPDAPVELHIYPGADASFSLYEDEGDNYNYEEGLFSTIQFRWDDSLNTLHLGGLEGHYPGMPAERDFILVLHKDNKVESRQVRYTGLPLEVDLA